MLFFPCSIQALIIKDVHLVGATKTTKSAILNWANIKLNKNIDEEELEHIKEKLMRALQYILVKVEYFPKEEILQVEIKDKWSIFPVPLINQSGEYYARGFLIYENNFLGRLGTFAPGILWTNTGLNGLLYFQEDSFITHRVGLKVLMLHKSDLTKFKRHGRAQEIFETRFDTVIVTPNYQKGRHDHKLGPIYINKKVFDKNQRQLFESERFGLYYRHHYNMFRKLPILFDGLITTYDLFLMPKSLTQLTSQKIDLLHGGDIQYTYPHFKSFLKLQVHYHYTNNDGYLSPKMLGGQDGHRGYDKESIAAKENIGAMIEEKVYLFNQIFLGAFSEYNYIKLIAPVHKGMQMREITFGANISYFFEKLSVPAIILEYARNIPDKSHHFHVNIGIRL